MSDRRVASSEKQIRPDRTRLPLTLKPGTVPRQRDSIIHDPLADAEVAIKPLLGFFVFGDGFGAETGPEVPSWVLLAWQLFSSPIFTIIHSSIFLISCCGEKMPGLGMDARTSGPWSASCQPGW
jgi:hypothetical protein